MSIDIGRENAKSQLSEKLSDLSEGMREGRKGRRGVGGREKGDGEKVEIEGMKKTRGRKRNYLPNLHYMPRMF